MAFSFHQISVVQAKEAEIPNCRNEEWREHEENFRKRKFGFSKHVRVGGKSRVEGKIEMGYTGRRTD